MINTVAKRTRTELEKLKNAKRAELAKLKKAKAESAQLMKALMMTERAKFQKSHPKLTNRQGFKKANANCKKTHANADPKLTHKQAKRSLRRKPAELHSRASACASV